MPYATLGTHRIGDAHKHVLLPGKFFLDKSPCSKTGMETSGGGGGGGGPQKKVKVVVRIWEKNP